MLAASVVAVAAWRVRAVLYRALLDGRPFRLAVTAAVEAGDLAAARALATPVADTWLGSVVLAALDAHAEGEPVEPALTERLGDLRLESIRGLLWLRGATRLAPVLALLGVATALVTTPIAEDPTVLGRTLTALVGGVVTAFVAADATRILAEAAFDQRREAHRLAATLDRTLDPE